MALKLTVDNYQEITRQISLNNQSYVEKYDAIESYHKTINGDMSLFYLDANFNHDIEISGQSKQKGFFLTFQLEGHYALKNDKFTYSSKKNDITMIHIEDFDLFNHALCSKKYKTLGFFISDKFIEEKIKDNFFSKDIIKNTPMTLHSKICLNQILQSPYKGSLNDIFLESKVLEILSCELHELFKSEDSLTNTIFTQDDIYAIHNAKEILLNNIKNNFSLKQLALKSKINEFKLKKGFKRIFGQSPYKMLKEKRMIEARILLENSEYNIYEISQLVGFKNQSHFTKNFSEYFGVLPKDIMKNRKYYY